MKSNVDPSENNQDAAKSKARNWIIAICIIALVLVLTIAIIVWISPNQIGAQVKVREQGEYPDFSYLSSLTSEPDHFFEALNVPEASEIWADIKETGSSSSEYYMEPGILCPIELDEYASSGDSGSKSPELQVYLDTSEDFIITDFALTLYEGSFVEGDYGLERLSTESAVDYEIDGLNEAMLLAMLGDDSKMGSATELLFNHAKEFEQKFYPSYESIESVFEDPDIFLSGVGVNLDSLNNVTQVSGAATPSDVYGNLFVAYVDGEYPVVGQEWGLTKAATAAGRIYQTTGQLDEESYIKLSCSDVLYLYLSAFSDNRKASVLKTVHDPQITLWWSDEEIEANAEPSVSDDIVIPRTWVFHDGKVEERATETTGNPQPIVSEENETIIGSWALSENEEEGILRIIQTPRSSLQLDSSAIRGEASLQDANNLYTGSWEYIESGSEIDGFAYHYIVSFDNNYGQHLTYYLEMADKQIQAFLGRGSEALMFTRIEEPFFGNYYKPIDGALVYLSVYGSNWRMGTMAISDGQVVGGGLVYEGNGPVQDFGDGFLHIAAIEGPAIIIEEAKGGVQLTGADYDFDGVYYEDFEYAVSQLK